MATVLLYVPWCIAIMDVGARNGYSSGSFLPADRHLGDIVRTGVAVATDVLLPGSLRVYRGRRPHQDESPIRFFRSGGGELRLPIPESPLAQAS